MRTQHRLAAAAAVAGLTLTAACSSGTGASSEGDGKTLRVAAVATDRAGMEAAIKGFKKSHPDVKLSLSYSDTDQYQSTIRTQLSSGTAPDLFFVWPGNGNPGAMEVLAPSGYIEDLSDRPWVDQIPEGIKPVTQVDGKTYILPLSFSGIGAIYNKDALAEVGAQPPTTWTQLLALCDVAKEKGKAAFALGNQTSWVTQLVDYALVPTTVYANQPDFDNQMSSGSASFTKSGWKTAMDKYLTMNRHGCFQKDPLGTSFESSLAQVAEGDAVATVQVTSVFNQLKSQAPEGAEFGLFPLPATENADDTQMPGAAGGSYGVNAKSPNKKLAVELLDYLGSAEGMNTYAGTTGNLPSIPNSKFELDPALQPLVDYQRSGKTVPYMDQLWPNPKVQQAHFTGVQEMFSGEATAQDVLSDMDEAYDEK